VFERFTEETRACVTCAEEDARALGHAELAPGHLLLGVARVCSDLVPRDARALRDAVAAAHGTAPPDARPDVPDALPLTATARVVLVTTAQDGAGEGAGPHDLLLALAQVAPAVLRRLGLDPRDARERALAARQARPPRPATLPELLRGGGPVEARLGAHLLGDLGHPRVDARVLQAVLARGGRVAAVLRERGVDEALLAPYLRDDPEG
jgi:hypothetical protein